MANRAYTVLLVTLLFAGPLAAQPIPFDICAESTTWTRPTPEVQAKLWNDPRYSGLTRDSYEWTHNFLVIDEPLSARAALGFSNASGLWTVPIRTFDNCYRSGDEWIEVWVLLHRVTEVRHDANTYTVIVQPTGKGFQSVLFRRLNPSVVLRFVTPDGKELEKWDESAPPDRVTNTVPSGTRIIGPNGEIIRK